MKHFILFLRERLIKPLPVFVVLYIITPLALFSQSTSPIDSLRNAFRSAASDSVRVALLVEQAGILIYENTDEAQTIITEAIRLSQKTAHKGLVVLSGNMQANLFYLTDRYEECIRQYKTNLQLARSIHYKHGTSQALVGLGNVYHMKGDYAAAKEYHLQNIAFCDSIQDFDGVASSYNNMGNIANEVGDYKQAIEYYTKSSELYQKTGAELPSAIVLANIGMIQNKLQSYNNAIRYFEQSNVVFRKLNYKPGINFVLKNMGIAFKNTGKLDDALQAYSEALDYYAAIRAVHQQSELLQNIGNIYWEKKDYGKAEAHYMNALKITSSVKDSVGMARAHNCLGALYHAKKDLHKAKEHFLKASTISQVTRNPLIQITAETDLHSVYAALGDFRNAYKIYKNYIGIRDSLHGIEKDKAAKEIEAKYQSERKEKEIALLSAQNQTKSLQIRKRENERIYLFSMVFITGVLGLVMYRMYAIKKRANTSLQRLNQFQSNFFTNISHEFRTPLTLILSALEKKRSSLNQNSDYDIKIIEQNTTRMLQLINQLLDLSRLEAGSEKLRVSEVNVLNFVRNLAASFTSLAEGRSIQFQIDISGDDVIGYLDTDKIEKIVFNLLSNAFKFTPPNRKVIFNAEANQKQVIINVIDNGSGIPPDSLKRIFQRFYQVNSADNRAYGGTGIGLSLTKELVELHGGTLTVDSEINKGSTFTLTIPLRGYDQKTITTEGEHEKRNFMPALFDEPVTKKVGNEDDVEHTPEEDKFTILLVEDNADLLHYLSQSLSKEYHILQARDGQEGYDTAAHHMPDLVITDLMMPKLDGRNMCKQIRDNEKTSHIPLIMLTAKADRESKLEGLDVGADDYLTKPFDAKELELKIRNIQRQRERLHEHIRNKFLFPESNLTANDKFIQKATEIIYANISNPDFSIEEFHREMGYSRMQLHRKLKSIAGHSATEFIRLVRLKKAALLLEKGHDQVAQVAYDTGFSSPSYFTKCFREVYGLTPSEYAAQKLIPRN